MEELIKGLFVAELDDKKKKNKNPHCKCLLHPDTLSSSWTAAMHSHSLEFTPLKSQWTGGRINCHEPRQGCQRETVRAAFIPPRWWVGRTVRAELCSGRGPGRAPQGWRDAGMHQASLDPAALSGAEPG